MLLGWHMLGRSPRFQALLDRSRQSIKRGEGLSEKAFWEAVRKRAQERRAATAKGRRTKKARLRSEDSALAANQHACPAQTELAS